MTLAEDIESCLGNREPLQADIWLEGVKKEVVGYCTELKNLNQLPADEAMGWLSSISARVHELIVQTVISSGQRATKFRIEALIPTRDELHWQFDVASRRVTLMKIEAEQLRGEAY